MGLLQKLSLLYPAIPIDTLTIILNDATLYAQNYCNLEDYDEVLDPVVLRMCKEDINKLFAEGYNSESTGGDSVNYTEDYAPQVYKCLNQHKRIRTI